MEGEGSSEPPESAIRQLLERNLRIEESNNRSAPKHGHKEKYAFWETQPVVQFKDDGNRDSTEDGPIAPPKTVEEVRQEPFNLPPSFEWCECDMDDASVVNEVYELLTLNYVEDDDAMFRFNYSPDFLQWAMKPPGYRRDWHVGVRGGNTKKLMGFISAVPATVRARGTFIPMVEINFLCVHKKLRTKRLAPVLIKEITRRVNLQNIWQATYTAGVVLPSPVATTRYWHRSLNAKKLIDVGFSRLAPRMTMARTIKLYRVAEQPATPGVRRMERRDVPQVTQLLNSYLSRYAVAQVFTEDETEHWVLPRDKVVESWVVETDGSVTDLISFYSLPSSILKHPKHHELNAAFMYYVVPGTTPIKELMQDALVLANQKGYDVFNALDILQNREFLEDLKFGIGDGNLQYYMYNWRMTPAPGQSPEEPPCKPEDIGLILL